MLRFFLYGYMEQSLTVLISAKSATIAFPIFSATQQESQSCLSQVGTFVFTVDPRNRRIHGRAAGICLVERVQHDKVMDRTLYPECGDLHARTAEFFAKGFALAAQNICLPVDDHGLGQTLQTVMIRPKG